jgi:tellurite resistance protein TehA-like permease
LRVQLADTALFIQKTVTVFAVSFALLPLVGLKSDIPATLYVVSLVVLHLFVLAIYLYRVRFRELDPDARSLVARLLAVAVVVYLLFAVSSFEEGAPRSTLASQMLGLSVLHTAMLALLMVRVRYAERTADELHAAASTDRDA